MRQSCKIVFQGLDAQHDLKKLGAEKDGYYHLIIDLATNPPARNCVTRQLSYAKLTEADGKWTISVMKQKAVCGDGCQELQTLYGTFPRPKRTSYASDLGSGEGSDCVICLTNPRDTVIVPCRHVCLCSTCAAVTSSTWSFQCPVCRARVTAMVKLGPDRTGAS